MNYDEAKIYYANKRKNILAKIKPLLEDFLGVKDYDYVIEQEKGSQWAEHEYLIICGDKIGCSMNSESASVEEAFGWAIVRYYAYNRHLGAFHKQVLNQIKSYWMKEETK